MSEKEQLVDFPLRVKRSDFDSLIQQDLGRLKRAREDLCREQKDYAEMRKSVAQVHFTDPIILDVGGKRFKTSLATLRRDESSMLAAMFSGTGFEIQPDVDGSIFIDRDGKHFRYILNYLRGCFSLAGLSEATREELAAEADFYQLKDLYTLLKPPIITFKPEARQGIIHHLGSRAGADVWVNPCTLNSVRVSGTLNLLDEMLARSSNSGTGCCNSAKDKFIVVELVTAKLRPTHVSLAWNGNCHRGATWMLSGCVSLDVPETWLNLASSADRSQPSTTSPTVFPVSSGCEQFYKKFKLCCTGPDEKANCYCFHVGQLEFYGDMMEDGIE